MKKNEKFQNYWFFSCDFKLNPKVCLISITWYQTYVYNTLKKWITGEKRIKKFFIDEFFCRYPWIGIDKKYQNFGISICFPRYFHKTLQHLQSICLNRCVKPFLSYGFLWSSNEKNWSFFLAGVPLVSFFPWSLVQRTKSRGKAVASNGRYFE